MQKLNSQNPNGMKREIQTPMQERTEHDLHVQSWSKNWKTSGEKVLSDAEVICSKSHENGQKKKTKSRIVRSTAIFGLPQKMKVSLGISQLLTGMTGNVLYVSRYLWNLVNAANTETPNKSLITCSKVHPYCIMLKDVYSKFLRGQ